MRRQTLVFSARGRWGASGDVGPRDALVEQATSFLTHKSVASTPIDERINFPRDKGLTEAQISQAPQRVASPPEPGVRKDKATTAATERLVVGLLAIFGRLGRRRRRRCGERTLDEPGGAEPRRRRRGLRRFSQEAAADQKKLDELANLNHDMLQRIPNSSVI